jgi:hypothetical protein
VHPQLPSGELTTVDGKGQFTPTEKGPVEPRTQSPVENVENQPFERTASEPPSNVEFAPQTRPITSTGNSPTDLRQSGTSPISLGKPSMKRQRTTSQEPAPPVLDKIIPDKTATSTAEDDAIASMHRMMLSFANPAIPSNKDQPVPVLAASPAAQGLSAAAPDVKIPAVAAEATPPPHSPMKSVSPHPTVGPMDNSKLSTPHSIPLPVPQNLAGAIQKSSDLIQLSRPPRSRSSSTTATPLPGILRNSITPERRVKRESPFSESPLSTSTLLLNPYIHPSLEILPTEQRIEELRRLQTTLPILIEREEERLQEERALEEREEAMRAEQRKLEELRDKEGQLFERLREQQEETERLRKELDEIKRQQNESLTGIRAYVL